MHPNIPMCDTLLFFSFLFFFSFVGWNSYGVTSISDACRRDECAVAGADSAKMTIIPLLSGWSHHLIPANDRGLTHCNGLRKVCSDGVEVDAKSVRLFVLPIFLRFCSILKKVSNLLLDLKGSLAESL